jgi:Spy/CpxP family protein refolding chaperone
VCLLGAAAQAQEVTQNPQERLRLNYLREVERYVTVQARSQQGDVLNRGSALAAQISGAWWTNTALVERLGLTDDQKAKIERAFENHRQNIVSSTGLLEKEEAQLNRLLEAETIDRNAVLTQIDRVVQARGEVERANSAMTLEMREHLTRAQWLQLPRTTGAVRFSWYSPGARGGRGTAPAPVPTPAQPGTGGRRGGGGRGPQ